MNIFQQRKKKNEAILHGVNLMQCEYFILRSLYSQANFFYFIYTQINLL
jgi:hypothetical protein